MATQAGIDFTFLCTPVLFRFLHLPLHLPLLLSLLPARLQPSMATMRDISPMDPIVGVWMVPWGCPVVLEEEEEEGEGEAEGEEGVAVLDLEEIRLPMGLLHPYQVVDDAGGSTAQDPLVLARDRDLI